MSEQPNIKTVAELLKEDDHKSTEKLVQIAAGILITLGLGFTFVLNFFLYSRPFPASYQIIGLLPAALIEGSLATFLLGSFVWFAHGLQGKLASLFGWAMFAIVAGNTIVEFNAMAGTATSNAWIDLYAFWGVPIVVPLVVGFWKAVIDADPRIQAMRTKRRVTQAVEQGVLNATIVHLSTDEHRKALADAGTKHGQAIDRSLTGSVNGKVPADSPNASSQRQP